MLTPNIGFDDSYISSALWVSDLFTAVIRELKRGWQGVHKVSRERETSPGFFFIRMEEEGKGREV